MISRVPKLLRMGTSEVEIRHTACLHIYRSIQTLEKMYNVFLKDQIVPGMVSCLPGKQTK